MIGRKKELDEKGNILIVDDDPGTCRMLALMFGKRGYEIEIAGTGREAIEKAQRRFFNVALLDIRLPEMDGVELIALLREMHPDMVVIMVTAYASLENAVRALNEGASAYLTKPLDMDRVLTIVKEVIEKQRLVMENRRLYEATQQELAKHKQGKEVFRYLAYYDSLSGLPNRVLFNDLLTKELARAHRNQQRVGVLLLDLDRFKEVNDTLGHTMGDKLLRAVGERLTGLLRRSDTVARLGGDEYILLLPEIAGIKDATMIAQKILETIRKPFVLDSHELHIATSIGIAIYPNDGEDVDTLMKNADIAMYHAKNQGRDNYQCYPGKEEKVGRKREHSNR